MKVAVKKSHFIQHYTGHHLLLMNNECGRIEHFHHDWSIFWHPLKNWQKCSHKCNSNGGTFNCCLVHIQFHYSKTLRYMTSKCADLTDMLICGFQHSWILPGFSIFADFTWILYKFYWPEQCGFTIPVFLDPKGA